MDILSALIIRAVIGVPTFEFNAAAFHASSDGTPSAPYIPPYPYDPISTTPTKAPEVPAKAPSVSTKAPEVPTTTPDVPTDTPNIPTKAPSLPTKVLEVPVGAQRVSTTGPAFHGSPIHSRITDVSQREIDLLDKLASTMQSFADDLKQQSCRQSVGLQGHDSAQGNDFLESSDKLAELCVNFGDLLEAEQILRGILLSSMVDGPGDLRMPALVEHRRMMTAFQLKYQSISDTFSGKSSEAGILSEETPHAPIPPEPEEPGDEERDNDMAKD